MLVIETKFIAAIETNIGVDFKENGIVKDRIELAELNDFVWREKAYSLDFCSSEENIRSEKNSRSLMKWLKKTRSKSDEGESFVNLRILDVGEYKNHDCIM